jgi:peptide-methionine (S)-S-oxide reductase
MSTLPDPFALPLPSFDPQAHAEQIIVLGGGCFWCTEAVFSEVRGVRSVLPGYAGDALELATYDAVCSGKTEHAEVIRVVYDADQVSLGTLLRIFFGVAHDPTQKDGQGHDLGHQYRSAVFFATEAQREVVTRYITELDASHAFGAKIVTEVLPLVAFFPAEEDHHAFAARNPHQPYIRAVSTPKVQKLRSAFASLTVRGQP